MALLRVHFAVLLLAWSTALAVPMHSADAAADEYQLKAAFLFNFAKFIEWPAEAFVNGAQINICVVGNGPFAAQVAKAVAGKEIANRSFQVQTYIGKTEGVICHIVFVSASEQKRLATVLKDFRDAYALTVGECDTFLAQGGIINLRLQESRVHIEINTEAAARLKSRISSKLLSLADAPKR